MQGLKISLRLPLVFDIILYLKISMGSLENENTKIRKRQKKPEALEKIYRGSRYAAGKRPFKNIRPLKAFKNSKRRK
jgi:hypothetical protein